MAHAVLWRGPAHILAGPLRPELAARLPGARVGMPLRECIVEPELRERIERVWAYGHAETARHDAVWVWPYMVGGECRGVVSCWRVSAPPAVAPDRPRVPALV